MIRFNITANFIGQFLSSGIGFIFIPIYIRYLGIESYGLIGLFAIVTAWLGIVDGAISPVINREMALYSSGEHTANSIRILLWSIECIFIILGLIIVVLMIPAATWLATNWIKSMSLSFDIVINSIYLMLILFWLKLFESLYKSSFIGLQHQVKLNLFESSISIVRAVGAFLLLKYVSKSIIIFFLWQILLTLIYIIFQRLLLNRLIPKTNESIKFSLRSLYGIKNFTGGMLILVLLTLFQTQMDKILLSKILSLQEFGYYNLVFTAAGALMIFTSPVSQALFPQMTVLYQKQEMEKFKSLFHLGTQLIVVFLGSASLVLAFFPKYFMFFWTNNSELTIKTYNLLPILSISFLFNGINTMAFSSILAFSWIKKWNVIKLINVIIILPLIVFFVPKYGVQAALILWLLFSIIQTFINGILISRSNYIDSFFNWIFNDVFKPLFPCVIILLYIKKYILINVNYVLSGITLAILFITCIILSVLFSDKLRSWVYVNASNFFTNKKFN